MFTRLCCHFFQNPPTVLGATDMHNLVQYSSHLETTGYQPLIEHVIPDPNRSRMFWDSVDQYVQINGNVYAMPNVALRPRTQPPPHRQLDKYNLEVRGQEFIESTVPLLLPPLDTSP